MSTATTTRTTNTTTTTTTGIAGTSGNTGPDVQPPPAEPIGIQNAHVTYARVRMPTVTNTNIEAWFTSMDYWFIASGITADQQRFSTILAAIDPNVLAQLTDAIREQPAEGKYEFIKLKLIAHFADSEQRKLNRLLSEMPLGDKRPSELYHEMKQVAGNVLGEAALKGLWSQRLPEAARPVVAASTGTATEFTRIADSIVDVLTSAPTPAVNAAAANPLGQLNEIKAAIAELRNQINNFPRNSRSRSRGASNQQRPRTPANNGTGANANPASNSNTNANADSDVCWYHQTYGQNARNCRSPCRRRTRSRTPAAPASNETA